MNDQEIYQKVGELLWSIIPHDAEEIIFTGKIYPTYLGWGTDFILKNGTLTTFAFGQEPTAIELEIRDLMNKLKEVDVFKEKWTNYRISLTEEGKFNIEFEYIPEEDNWPNLYMRRVSDLKLEELDEYNIPIEEWENRVKLRNQSK